MGIKRITRTRSWRICRGRCLPQCSWWRTYIIVCICSVFIAVIFIQQARIEEYERAVFDYRNGNFTIISLSHGRTYNNMYIQVHNETSGWTSRRQYNGRAIIEGYRQYLRVSNDRDVIAYIFTCDAESTMLLLQEVLLPYRLYNAYGHFHRYYTVNNILVAEILNANKIPFISAL